MPDARPFPARASAPSFPRVRSAPSPVRLRPAPSGRASCSPPCWRSAPATPRPRAAEAHYQRALALLAEGDTARAALEFRNVFRLDEAHAAARLAYAGLLRDRGETGEALSQLLRLVEQDPKNLEGQRTLAALALEAGDFDTAAARRRGLRPRARRSRGRGR